MTEPHEFKPNSRGLGDPEAANAFADIVREHSDDGFVPFSVRYCAAYDIIAWLDQNRPHWRDQK